MIGRGRWPAPRPGLVAVSAAVVFLVGAVTGRALAAGDGADPGRPPRPAVSGSASSPDPPAERQRPDGPVPGRVAGGLPAGFAPSDAGAWAAGLAYACADQVWLYLSDGAIGASLAAVATPEAAARLTGRVTGAVGLLRDALAVRSGPVWWVVRPLAARLVEFSPGAATVAVWVVSVLSAADVAVPQARWATRTVELVWRDGDWRLDGWSDRPGPTPVLDASDEPWSPKALAEALVGFELLAVGE